MHVDCYSNKGGNLFSDMSLPVYAVGRNGPDGIRLLGTAFAVSRTRLATAAHVVGEGNERLAVILHKHSKLGDYQDTTDPQVNAVAAHIVAYDAVRDLAIIELEDGGQMASHLRLGNADDVGVGEAVSTVGYPHAPEGRMVQTAQTSFVGAKVLLGSAHLPIKHLVLNVQARPGQSGSPVLHQDTRSVVAMVLGGWVPPGGSGIMLGNIDPYTLHQTTHAISCHYFGAMIDA